MFTEDFNPFFEDSEFSTFAEYKGNSIPVIFDNQHIEISDGYQEVSTREPVALIQDSFIDGWEYQEEITVNNTVYLIDDVEPDGTGLSSVNLKVK